MHERRNRTYLNLDFYLGGRLPPGLLPGGAASAAAAAGLDRQLLASLQQQAGSGAAALPPGLPSSPAALSLPTSAAAGNRSLTEQLNDAAVAAGLPHLTPNLYEMAALTTQELDTVVSVRNIFF